MKKMSLSALLLCILFFMSTNEIAHANTELQEEIEVLTIEYNETIQLLAERQIIYTQLVKRLTEADAQRSTMKTELSKQQAALNKLQNELTSKKNVLKTYKKKNTALAKGTATQRKKYNAQVTKLQKEAKIITTKITAQTKKVTTAQTKYRAAQNEVLKLQTTLDEAKKAIRISQMMLEEQQSSLAILQNALEEIQGLDNTEDFSSEEEEVPMSPPKPQLAVPNVQFLQAIDFSKAVETYELTSQLMYYEFGTSKNYAAVIRDDEQLIGGYETAIGKNVHNWTLGQTTFQTVQNGTFQSIVTITDPTTNIAYQLHFDAYDGQKLRAVEWWTTDSKFVQQVSEAKQLVNVSISTVSKIYSHLANEFRVKNGMKELQYHELLTKAAANHSVDMATKNYFSHMALDGASLMDRIKRVMQLPTAYMIAENIAAGQTSIFSAHIGWINSLGHRNNLLNERLNAIGFGVGYNTKATYRIYFTTKFAMF